MICFIIFFDRKITWLANFRTLKTGDMVKAYHTVQIVPYFRHNRVLVFHEKVSTRVEG